MIRLILVLVLLVSGSVLEAQPQLSLEQVANGFSSSVAMAAPSDGSNRLFIVERSGRIRIYDFNSGSILANPFLDIASKVTSGGERGLLGMAFHPDFSVNGLFYVNYTFTEQSQLKTKVERYTVSADPNVADPNSDVQIIEVNQPFSNHNAGDIKFGPDNMLYITMGDGGSGFDPDNRAQDTTDLLGSLLRLDIDSTDFPGDPDKFYHIPENNPFVNDPSVLDEFWSIGLRNPWRMSFDRNTGDLYIADVGQGDLEEVNFQANGDPGGQNYGWSCREGTMVQNFNPCIAGPLTDPIFEYGRSDGFSITGGFVYRGTVFPALEGYYICADYGSGNFWAINSTDFLDVTKFSLEDRITSFGESESGELYAVSISGVLYRVFDPNLCPDSVQVTDHNEEEYTADIDLTSDIPVLENQNVTYASPDIQLETPFEVEEMGNFLAQSLSCTEKIILEKF